MTNGNSAPVISIRDITKTYKMGDVEVHALRGTNLDIYRGDLMAIMGPSGSGKSTLMNILGCLDQPTSGTYKLDGLDVEKLKDDQLAEARNKKIGFVFQSFNLLRRTSAIDNVEQPMIYAGVNSKQRHERAKAALTSVGLGDRLDHHSSELSGGQQQRVAIARALVNQPAIILADEPTGNLDTARAREIMELLVGLNQTRGLTVIMVTHEAHMAEFANRTLNFVDGKIKSETLRDAA